MNHLSPEQEATRILQVFHKDPSDHRALLGVSEKIVPLTLYRKHRYFGELFKAGTLEENEAFGLVQRAHELLLREYIARKHGSWSFMAALFLSLTFSAGIGAYLLGMVWPGITAWDVLGSLVIGLLATDFVIGVTHLLLDHFISFEHPILGDVALDFNFHHQDPKNITRNTPKELFKPIIVYGLPTAAVISLLLSLTGNTIAILSGLWMGPLFCAAQLIHRLAHLDRPPNRLTHWLQRMRIFLPPEQHRKHHRDGERINFCNLNGLCNPLVNLMAAVLLRRLPRRSQTPS
jgi:sterol desaturase/sphingolipid hydroxylase (fatty acid hydroxylase superfamily)